ncbi:hypothetical protein GCM10012280_32940 [Wenjunlia tyrosinilytica]|uniref:Uncharacterized protein n=2 Tax=Wenjunlia tyrosinilytica TaxID=1544741 RepID=A0A918DY35_9ACTN|nr:hypothetical protein GCM10012280_32940 [Wenjunlia tyrosinilytica]
MAFSADELRVLRRALARALHPTETPAPSDAPRRHGPCGPPVRESGRVEDIQEYLRLSEAMDEAVREGGRLRAFLLADLRRYRDALPGGAPGYLDRLTRALEDGYPPTPDDLAALRSLRALPCAREERARRTALLRRCHDLAEREVRARLGGARRPVPVPATPLLGGVLRRSKVLDVLFPEFPEFQEFPAPSEAADEPARPKRPAPKPADEPTEEPNQGPKPEEPERERPRFPTPAEIFPPRRRSQPQPPEPDERLELATG